MKHLSKLLLALFFVLGYTFVNAQDNNNPWSVSVGITATDFYPVGNSAPQGSLFSQFFKSKDHWNVNAAVSKVSVARYLGSGLSARIDGSAGKYTKYGDIRVDERTLYSLNGGVEYSLGYLIFGEGAQRYVDPYIIGTAGSTWVADKAEFVGGAGLGLNFWFTPQVALTLSSTYYGAFNHNYAENNHFQHFAGIKFSFGGKDTDGDGIYDKDDECPNEPGLPEFNGCPDTDGDGIPDHLDDCPDEYGLAEFNGCPDTDGDGIPNHLDECPTEYGLKEFNGCPDTDGDGIPDHLDDCPNEAGPQENNGCPWPDRDGDGIPDHLDECPDIPGTAANNGCPDLPAAKVIDQLNEYSKTILFDTGKSTIMPDSYDAMRSMSEVMDKYPNANFHLAGFTDSTGSLAVNNRLSKERAAAVKDYLVERLGISADRLTSEGYGPKNPIATNNTADGRAQNRRVEIMLQKDRQALEDTM